ncbi:MAG: 1-hydroxycarotenoid 3,4-desaturase CrtD [Pseudomonadota bacterium]
MNMICSNNADQRHVVVIGAGIGGLATALRLASQGVRVTVLERHSHAGGKMRTLPSRAGPVDTGPTVLTMRKVFDDLFASAGERLDEHITLHKQTLIARHFWPDGSRLDLFDDPARNVESLRAFAGPKAADQFIHFNIRTQALFDGLNEPVMQAAAPKLSSLVAYTIARPRLARQMAPFSTLARLLKSSFDDPRLAQLFGRYATYVGGSPYQSPALLALIWQSEMAGVWVVEGGMSALATKIAELAATRGANFFYDAHVSNIETNGNQVSGVTLENGTRIEADAVVFNGDPRALATGALGEACNIIAPQTEKTARSLSAEVWAFAAKANGPELAHHNVFFRDDPKPEFDAIMRGERCKDPTLYVCALDRGIPKPPPPLERFEIIANAPSIEGLPQQEEFDRCQTRTFRTLTRHGLSFSPEPDQSALTTPSGFERLFPATRGSLYGQSPHGMMAAFHRPTAKTIIDGLYLAGGGTHPGAGVPMAALSGRHAAEAILQGQISTSKSRRTDMHGGMSTGSAMTASARSASSRS